MFGWPCFILFWHRLARLIRISEQSELYECTCGRKWGINHNVRAVLQWNDVKEFYERKGCKRYGRTLVR